MIFPNTQLDVTFRNPRELVKDGSNQFKMKRKVLLKPNTTKLLTISGLLMVQHTRGVISDGKLTHQVALAA